MNPIGNMVPSLVVKIGGRLCASVIQTSDSSLRCTVGAGKVHACTQLSTCTPLSRLAIGTGRNHSVIVAIGASQSNGSVSISYNAPILYQIVPSLGPVAGNNEVNLTYDDLPITISLLLQPNWPYTIGTEVLTSEPVQLGFHVLQQLTLG
ncbi:hypothetical protein BKA69DRAFT_168034 [Paraphysoderma sedebokerense]|nr:hypothetical protein BKA69DRAFT_168034 [Paraphysoderma sedebokerense]